MVYWLSQSAALPIKVSRIYEQLKLIQSWVSVLEFWYKIPEMRSSLGEISRDSKTQITRFARIQLWIRTPALSFSARSYRFWIVLAESFYWDQIYFPHWTYNSEKSPTLLCLALNTTGKLIRLDLLVLNIQIPRKKEFPVEYSGYAYPVMVLWLSKASALIRSRILAEPRTSIGRVAKFHSMFAMLWMPAIDDTAAPLSTSAAMSTFRECLSGLQRSLGSLRFIQPRQVARSRFNIRGQDDLCRYDYAFTCIDTTASNLLQFRWLFTGISQSQS